MSRVRVRAAHMGELLVQNSPNKGPFAGRFSLNMDGFSRNWQKIVNNRYFFAKIHHKSGYDGNLMVIRRG